MARRERVGDERITVRLLAVFSRRSAWWTASLAARSVPRQSRSRAGGDERIVRSHAGQPKEFVGSLARQLVVVVGREMTVTLELAARRALEPRARRRSTGRRRRRARNPGVGRTRARGPAGERRARRPPRGAAKLALEAAAVDVAPHAAQLRVARLVELRLPPRRPRGRAESAEPGPDPNSTSDING